LEWDIQYYYDASMELSKEDMIVKDDDSAENYWNKTMEKFLQKGIDYLLQI
jgi:hypothetical protein